MADSDPNSKGIIGRIRQGSVSLTNPAGSTDASGESRGFVGRVRGASVSLMNANPQLGMWQASGLAIAQAPNLSELRDPGSGGNKIEFNSQGHSMRTALEEADGELTLVKSVTRAPAVVLPAVTEEESKVPTKDDGLVHEEPRLHHHHSPFHHDPNHHHRTMHERAHDFRVKRRTLRDKHKSDCKEKWGPTIMHALRAFWKFFKTPSGFLITIYFLNIVAWGAMLFFLLLKAAPAMNHPDGGDADSSPRKIWIEIDSQILNALFCVTGFGLAPWRFRDLYWYIQARWFHNRHAIGKLYKQNKAWFRPPAWATNEPDGSATDGDDDKEANATVTTVRSHPRIDMPFTFTGERAPPTRWWKLAFVIWMMVANTILQAVLSFYMWHYNRIDRPTWATGTFIALGCGVAMLAGLMSWWEGRKVKKIEGPEVKIVEAKQIDEDV